MGKLSKKDFDEMAGRLRTRALSLMRQLELDPAGYKSTIERELEGRLKTAKITPAAAAAASSACRGCQAGKSTINMRRNMVEGAVRGKKLNATISG